MALWSLFNMSNGHAKGSRLEIIDFLELTKENYHA
jgi:hypothetical protein